MDTSINCWSLIFVIDYLVVVLYNILRILAFILKYVSFLFRNLFFFPVVVFVADIFFSWRRPVPFTGDASPCSRLEQRLMVIFLWNYDIRIISDDITGTYLGVTLHRVSFVFSIFAKRRSRHYTKSSSHKSNFLNESGI